jgi:hypothetical protein
LAGDVLAWLFMSWLLCGVNQDLLVLRCSHRHFRRLIGHCDFSKKEASALFRVSRRPPMSGRHGIQVSIEGEMAMRSDADLKADLMERLDAIPAINASDIEVDVDNGLATLSGQVDTQQTRFQVERMARRIAGLRGLEINIKPGQPVSKKHHH